jgi:HD-like signal output (HDOD) protein
LALPKEKNTIVATSSKNSRCPVVRELILEKLKVSGYLPPLPDVLFALQKLMDNPDCNVEDARRLIASDPVLSSRIITMANSALFAGGRDLAQNIEDAIVRLGLGAVLELCYTLELPGCIKVPQTFGQTRYWRHGLAVAILSRELGNKVLTDKEELDSCYLAGLVHDIGLLVYDYLVPDEYHQFLTTTDFHAADLPLETLEKNMFGISHSELGAIYLKEWWPVSEKIVEATHGHGGPGLENDQPSNLTRLVSTANRIANKYKLDHPFETGQHLSADENYLEALNMSREEMDELVDWTQIGLLAAESVL